MIVRIPSTGNISETNYAKCNTSSSEVSLNKTLENLMVLELKVHLEMLTLPEELFSSTTSKLGKLSY